MALLSFTDCSKWLPLLHFKGFVPKAKGELYQFITCYFRAKLSSICFNPLSVCLQGRGFLDFSENPYPGARLRGGGRSMAGRVRLGTALRVVPWAAWGGVEGRASEQEEVGIFWALDKDFVRVCGRNPEGWLNTQEPVGAAAAACGWKSLAKRG